MTVQDVTSLEEQERLRAEFLATVSHELRTPVATVKGSVATLLDPPSPLNPSEMRQFHRIIKGQMDRMHVLISGLLDVARIETGALAASLEATDVAALISEAGNSPESSPIRVSAVRDGARVAVSVSGRGRGIPAENLPRLFRKFSRIESGEQGGGAGLGLAICRGIVEAHGGRIWAESDGPGLGARFTFTIPAVELAGYASPAPSIPGLSSRRRAAEQARVLAVDDDPQALRHIRDALVKSGYTPIVTADPEQALRLVEEERPHLVLLDPALPGADGMELMKGHCGGGRAGHLPVGPRPGAVRGPGAGRGGGQALLGGGAGGPHQGGPAPAGNARAVSALRAGRPDHRLRRAPSECGRSSGASHRHRVSNPGRACVQRRACTNL